MPFEVAVQHNGSEGKSPDESVTVPLNISTFSYGSEEFNKKIQWTNSNVKKRNSREFLFCFTRNKAGNTRAIAPKESIYKKGGWNMNKYSLFDIP